LSEIDTRDRDRVKQVDNTAAQGILTVTDLGTEELTVVVKQT